MGKLFLSIGTAFAAAFTWLWNVILDISTFLREGDKHSSFSSKRLCGIFLVYAGIKLLYVGLSAFQQIIDKGWYAVMTYIPAVLCFIVALILFYINGKISISDAATKAETLIKAAKAKES